MIRNGDILIFATQNENKVALYRNVLDAQGVNVTLFSLRDLQEIAASEGKPLDLTMPPEDSVDNNGTYAGNSLRKAKHIASILKTSGYKDFEHAKVIADDWGTEIEGLYWSIDTITGEKTICTTNTPSEHIRLHPFPGLDTQPFIDSFSIQGEKEALNLSDRDCDLKINERAMHTINNKIQSLGQPVGMDYTTVLSVVDVATEEVGQFSGRLKGIFHYPPILGEHGFGTDICMQPLGCNTTLSNIADRESKGLVAEALAVMQALKDPLVDRSRRENKSFLAR